MTGKITLANGVVIEYDGDVLIDKDGSMIFGAGQTISSFVDDKRTTEDMADAQASTVIDALLNDTEAKSDINVQMIDAMLNVTKAHFNVFKAMVERPDVASWTTKTLAKEMNISEVAALGRLCNLVFAQLVYRPKRGVYCVRAEAACEYGTEKSRITAERTRRHSFTYPYKNVDLIEDDQKSG